MTRPLVRIILFALVSITGIVGMLLAESGWDWTFFALAALPLLLGGGLFLARRIREGWCAMCEQPWSEI